ncbi:non-specific serine/threonine protein kinase, partial [Trachipleistophora hominis]
VPLFTEMNLILKNKDSIIFEKHPCSYESSPIFTNLLHSLNEVAKKYFNSKLLSFEIGPNLVEYYRSESGVVIIWSGTKEQKLDMNTVYRDYADAVLYGDIKLFTDKYGDAKP